MPNQQRPNSQPSSDPGTHEEDALLTGLHTGKTPDLNVRSKWRELGLFVWALLATAAVVVLAVVYQHSQAENLRQDEPEGCIGRLCGREKLAGKRNLIFMVSDGMGPTSLSLTRSWLHHVRNVSFEDALTLDRYLIGQSRTKSSSSLVTDSAAGATAFSCGLKSYNGAISVRPEDFDPCASVMEAAKRKGYTTGLVVTTRMTDATPAVFVAHARRREMEDSIARQMVGDTHPLGRMVDLMFGGGRCHFLPKSDPGGCRQDEVDVTEKAREIGWNYIDSKRDFDQLDGKAELPMLALFAPHDIPYEIDRQHEEDSYPSLEAMTKTALSSLAAATKDSDKGFFVMIEGSRIDHAGHANDPAAQVHEVAAYDRALAAVLHFIDHSPVPTLLLATSDHETGGLATARQLHDAYPPYLWYPGVLANASHSASYVAQTYHAHLREAPSSSSDDLREYLTALTSDNLGITDPSEEELNALTTDPASASLIFAGMLSRRAQTGWSTHGHSAADVNIYSSSPTLASALRGVRENIEVGAFMAKFLGVRKEVEKVRKALRHFMHFRDLDKWLGAVPGDGERLDGQDHLDEYGGDHRSRRCEVCGGL